MLGKSSTIRAVGEERAITSNCINTQIASKLTYPQSSAIQPERVDVVFSSDRSAKIATDVLILNDNMMSPLRTAAYIKLVGMFFGLEDLAVTIYNEIAANYRCTAAKVNAAVKAGNYPSGRLISAVNHPKGSNKFMVAQNSWWSILATDAGVNLVDVKGQGGKGDSNQYAIDTGDAGSKLAKESWAIIDTTQYLTDFYGADAIDFPRIDKESWVEMSGAAKDSYAFKHDKVFLADKTVGIWNRHSKFLISISDPTH